MVFLNNYLGVCLQRLKALASNSGAGIEPDLYLDTANYLYFGPLFSLEIKVWNSGIVFILPLQVWALKLGKI